MNNEINEITEINQLLNNLFIKEENNNEITLTFKKVEANNKEEINNENCPICLDACIKKSSKCLKCSIYYHRKCIKAWLKQSKTCPHCKCDSKYIL